MNVCRLVCRTSVLVFMRESATVVGLAVLGVFYISIQLLAPYVYSRTDTLQQVVQTELLMLLLAARTLDSSPESAALLDTVLSIVLLAAAAGVLVLFASLAVQHVRQALYA